MKPIWNVGLEAVSHTQCYGQNECGRSLIRRNLITKILGYFVGMIRPNFDIATFKQIDIFHVAWISTAF
jgi:hypothetical protein